MYKIKTVEHYYIAVHMFLTINNVYNVINISFLEIHLHNYTFTLRNI